MAGKFKQFDNAFTREEIRECRRKFLDYYPALNEEGWRDNMWCHGYNQPSQSDVQFAVYEHHTARRWQLFRVSMKGLPTTDKMRMLSNYWTLNRCHDAYYGKYTGKLANHTDNSVVAWVRIMNYIGALVRGGQLDDNLNVIK